MKQLGIVLVFGLGVGVGCAAGTAMQTRVAEAQAPAGAQGWEFECFAQDKKARDLAAAGWQPYAYVDGIHCLRHPLP